MSFGDSNHGIGFNSGGNAGLGEAPCHERTPFWKWFLFGSIWPYVIVGCGILLYIFL